jgi:hypothetical protein
MFSKLQLLNDLFDLFTAAKTLIVDNQGGVAALETVWTDLLALVATRDAATALQVVTDVRAAVLAFAAGFDGTKADVQALVDAVTKIIADVKG